MSSWLLNMYVNAIMRKVKIEIGRVGLRFLEERRKCRLPILLYADSLVFCSESEGEMKMDGRMFC